MKKKVLFLIILVLVIASIFLIANNNKKDYYNLKKVSKYLYEITYNDYVEDINLETINHAEAFGCSSVRNGNFYGRNFDYIFNDVPEFIVKVKKGENRHASIGVATHFGLRENQMELNAYDKQLSLIPNFTLDGINDCGVICSLNVVPYADTLPVTGTNPNGKDLHVLFIPRFVLDNASSADDAINLLKGQNIYGILNNKYGIHLMIADKDKTYIVEFIDNKLVAQEKNGDEQIMTNFFNNISYYTENSNGIERYNILQENYNEGSTFEGMWKLLQRVRFSNVYKLHNEKEFYSEVATQSFINNHEEDEWQSFIEIMTELKKDYWNTINNDLRVPSNDVYWHTTHNSTYDIQNRKLRITIQENYNTYYEYDLEDI